MFGSVKSTKLLDCVSSGSAMEKNYFVHGLDDHLRLLFVHMKGREKKKT